MNAYRTWEQVAGYFDGDGTVSISDLSNQPFKLGLSLIFTDASLQQISMVRSFLISKGIHPSSTLKASSASAWIIALSRHDAVVAASKAMLPHLYKKANEIRAVINYYEGRTSGNDLANIFHAEVEAGRRERHPRRVVIEVPYTLPEGEMKMNSGRRIELKDAIGRYGAKVTPEDYEGSEENLKVASAYAS